MLRGIPDIIGSDLLKALADTGHGDLIVIADHFYPCVTKAPQAVSIQAKGTNVPEMLDAILQLVPLDVEYEKQPIQYIVPDADSGVVVESNSLRDYEMPGWISQYFSSRGLDISPDAAALLAEYAGTDMSKIVVETDKLLKNLPEGTTKVSSADIERNVGISREYSVFELTKELSFKNGAKAIAIATRLGESPRFAMPMAVSAMYTHFSRILKYAALKEKSRYPDKTQVAAALQGVNPFFWKEYDVAVANYPVRKAMAAISLLCEYDYKGKGGDAGEATAGELLVELTMKLLNL